MVYTVSTRGLEEGTGGELVAERVGRAEGGLAGGLAAGLAAGLAGGLFVGLVETLPDGLADVLVAVAPADGRVPAPAAGGSAVRENDPEDAPTAGPDASRATASPSRDSDPDEPLVTIPARGESAAAVRLTRPAHTVSRPNGAPPR